MYTRCPECETMFHLRVEDLRQAGGRVRCGECSHVFYGMDYLAEEPDQDAGRFAQSTDTESGYEVSPDSGDPPEEPIAEKSSSGQVEPDLEDDEIGTPEEILFTSDDGATDTVTLDEITSALEAASTHVDDDEPGDSDDDEASVGAAEDEELGLDEEPATLSVADDEQALEEDDEAHEAYDSNGSDSETAAHETLYAEDDAAEIESSDDEASAPEEAWFLVDEDDHAADLDDEPDDEPGSEDDGYGIDDTIWERIPGVGAGSANVAATSLGDSGQDDTGVFLMRAELDEPDDNDPESAEDSEQPFEHEESDHAEVIEDEKSNDQAPESIVASDDVSDEVGEKDADLEFNVPEEEWSTVFETSSELIAEDDKDIELQPDQIGASVAEEASPPWQFNKYQNVDLDSYNSRTQFWAICLLVLGTLLTGQIVHYNRDSLATSPKYGQNIRDFYAWIDLPLYPRWSIEDYEIRGSEAVVGETGEDVMDIRTQIAAVGDQPVGLPILRVVLRDRWSNPVAARNFSAPEYASDKDLPFDQLLQPNTNLAAQLSIIDPGSGAQGYELELCIPYRFDKLECSGKAFK